MSTLSHQVTLPDSVRHVLQRARRGVRIYVLIEGLAKVIILLGAVFWGGLLLDWLFEPSPGVRRVAIFAVAAAGLILVYRQVLRRAFVSLPDASMAVLLERRFKQLDDHVLTAVHLASPSALVASYHPDLVRQTQQAAGEAVRGIRAADLFQRRPLIRAVAAALVLVGSIVAFSALAPDAFGFWVQRMRLSPQPWPRRVHLEVVGFPADENGRRTQKIAQDDDVELIVHAAAGEFVIPDEVEIRFWLEDGRRGRDTMVRVGDVANGSDEFQRFRYVFKHVAGSMTFDVVGGDDRVRDLHLEVVDRPELFSTEVDCVYPSYLRRPRRRLPVTGGMRIPEGTQVALHASATKPLATARIHTSRDEQDAELSFTDDSRHALSWDYGTLTSDDVLLIDVTDMDGVACREPYRVSLSVVPDELPQIAVRLAGIGSAITPEAVIPLSGKITDDYGLDRIWFEYQVDGGPVHERPFASQPDGRPLQSQLDAFDTRALDEGTGERALRLRPGQKLFLSVKATDLYDLADMPRAGSSQQFALEVATVDQLLALLERRELSLRQRYEAIVEKVTDTRNLLSRVEFSDATDDSDEETPDDAGPAEDEAADSAALRALARRRLRIAGSLQNVTQSANEIFGIAEAFDDIHDQLVNNRIENAELRGRLHDDIALPLHRIAAIRMPQWEAQLQLVQEHVLDPEAGADALAKSISLGDEILVEMRQVLDRMLELESYNEVLSLLREIISDQEELRRKTDQRQKERLENLLED